MQMPQSPMHLQTDKLCRYFTHSPTTLLRDIVHWHLIGSWRIFTGYATITDGINPSVYFKREFFFWRTIFVCKTIGNCFFFPTDLAMELGITDERKADERFLSVKKLPMNSKSQTNRIFPSVKLCNLVVYVFFKSMPGSSMTQTPGPNNHARPKRI